jgi:hypothetical protein
MGSRPEMKCQVCKMWIPAGSPWQVNLPDHDVRKAGKVIHCTGSGRGPINTRGFRRG